MKKAIAESQELDVAHAEEFTVASWLKLWYDIYAQPNIRLSTANRYQLFIEKYITPRIGKIKLSKLTTRDLQKLYKELVESGRVVAKGGKAGLSTTTVRSVHLMLHCALDRAV